MSRRAPRIHRLPQRLDYTLIPAPLELSLPQATEKSSLPAIIVTPSSPSAESNYYIAFLSPPPKATFRERISPYLSPSQLSCKARVAFLVCLVLLVLALHFLSHLALAVHRPHLNIYASEITIESAHAASQAPVWDFSGLKNLWEVHGGSGAVYGESLT